MGFFAIRTILFIPPLNIIIGSVLKPLDDTRHYYKLAKSLSLLPYSNVFVLARKTPYKVESDISNIHFIPISDTLPNIFQRLLSSVRFFILLLKLKPQLVVVCTHELLKAATLGKWFLNYKLVYDIQENYVLNIRSNKTYKGWVQHLLTLKIKLTEWITYPFINQFWLAEACYVSELKTPKKNTFIFENKAVKHRNTSAITLHSKEKIKLIFSGTIAEETGVWEAISLVLALHQLDPRFSLHIIGCCHRKTLFDTLTQKANQHPSIIHLTISRLPLTYTSILEAMESADVGLVVYHHQANFEQKMPTKVYEYTALGLPIISNTTVLLSSFYDTYKNAVEINILTYSAHDLVDKLNNNVFYPHGNHPLKPLLWDQEKQHIQEAVKRLC